MGSRSGDQSAASPSVERPLAPGDVLGGKYRIDEVAGEGGMAAVYAAHHLVLDQRVAVKVLLAEGAKEPSMVDRFLREAQAVARLKSEHVARVMDAGILASGLPFLAMEYLDGCDLAELLRLQGPLPVVDVADYVLQALDCVAEAHVAGIVHRDLKPSNLYLALRPDGNNVIKVLDFGISKLSLDTREEVKRHTGEAILGSPAYMSPEQARSARTVDERSDIWSLGVCMYELLTGKIPFDGEGVGEMLASVLFAQAAHIAELRPDVPPDMAAVVHRCLERDRDARFADAAELARALAPLGSGRWTTLVDRIAGTLEKGTMSAPIGAFKVTKLVSILPGAPDPPTSSRLAFASAPSVEVADTVAQVKRDTTTVKVRARARRWEVVAVAAVVAASVVALVSLLHGRSRDVERLPAPAASPVLVLPPAPTPTPAPTPALASAPAPSLASAPAAPSSAPTKRAPPSRPSGPAGRPSILRSRD